MGDLTKRSIRRLEYELFDAAVAAWLGTCAGVGAMAGSTFWRFEVYPPRPLLGQNDKVWVFPGLGGEIIHGPMPTMDPMATVTWVVVFTAGLLLCWFATKQWRDIRSELARRGRA